MRDDFECAEETIMGGDVMKLTKDVDFYREPGTPRIKL
jgi:hypothetical protein